MNLPAIGFSFLGEEGLLTQVEPAADVVCPFLGKAQKATSATHSDICRYQPDGMRSSQNTKEAHQKNRRKVAHMHTQHITQGHT